MSPGLDHVVEQDEAVVGAVGDVAVGGVLGQEVGAVGAAVIGLRAADEVPTSVGRCGGALGLQEEMAGRGVSAQI